MGKCGTIVQLLYLLNKSAEIWQVALRIEQMVSFTGLEYSGLLIFYHMFQTRKMLVLSDHNYTSFPIFILINFLGTIRKMKKKYAQCMKG